MCWSAWRLGVILALFDLFDVLGEHSERVSGFLKRSSERAEHSAFLTRYGVYGLVPGVMILGILYLSPGFLDPRVAPDQIDPPDNGRIYYHLHRNDSCDDGHFQPRSLNT